MFIRTAAATDEKDHDAHVSNGRGKVRRRDLEDAFVGDQLEEASIRVNATSVAASNRETSFMSSSFGFKEAPNHSEPFGSHTHHHRPVKALMVRH
ncbi:hypothetical protein [Sinisalibacter aestuarii]|uniref:hypothetical protein n=1 Tax=Sinisalibacter aestuarii TaxID=2949426 RepID=UPI0024921FF1|nr:hypothetical protein [Sinisalibacter aestuarii]